MDYRPVPQFLVLRIALRCETERRNRSTPDYAEAPANHAHHPGYLMHTIANWRGFPDLIRMH
eukprot:13766782-Heterocapsa_arctica.AAC.1